MPKFTILWHYIFYSSGLYVRDKHNSFHINWPYNYDYVRIPHLTRCLFICHHKNKFFRKAKNSVTSMDTKASEVAKMSITDHLSLWQIIRLTSLIMACMPDAQIWTQMFTYNERYCTYYYSPNMTGTLEGDHLLHVLSSEALVVRMACKCYSGNTNRYLLRLPRLRCCDSTVSIIRSSFFARQWRSNSTGFAPHHTQYRNSTLSLDLRHHSQHQNHLFAYGFV